MYYSLCGAVATDGILSRNFRQRSTVAASAEIHRPHYIGSNTIHAFPVRVITVWNRLPTHVVLASSLLSFKISLKNVDLTYTLLGKI